MDLTIVAAIAKNNVIGRDGKLPWNYPEDMKHFKEITSGHVVIMGRNTYDSLPIRLRPLPNRTNIVLSHSMVLEPNVAVVDSLERAIESASRERSEEQEAYIIGGLSLYTQALPLARRMELTHLSLEFEGDTYFPEVNWNDWKEVKRDVRTDLSFISYERV